MRERSVSHQQDNFNNMFLFPGPDHLKTSLNADELVATTTGQPLRPRGYSRSGVMWRECVRACVCLWWHGVKGFGVKERGAAQLQLLCVRLTALKHVRAALQTTYSLHHSWSCLQNMLLCLRNEHEKQTSSQNSKCFLCVASESWGLLHFFVLCNRKLNTSEFWSDGQNKKCAASVLGFRKVRGNLQCIL